MSSKPRDWGKVMLGVRLEKMVEAPFVRSWSNIISEGLRPGDKWSMTEGMTATAAANALVVEFLNSKCDSLVIVDSDGEFDKDFVEKLRSHEPGFAFDALQAFYTRRGWPPQAIWFKRDERGVLHTCVVMGETTEDVELVGLHCAIIRRKVFEKLLGNDKLEEHDWFWYPRGVKMTEDAAFSTEALQAGFKLGATTAVKTGHIGHLSIGWDTYQEYIRTSGQIDQLRNYEELSQLIQKFTGESEADVIDKMMRGSKNVQEAWDAEKPTGVSDIHKFYGEDYYLYDLLNWNCSLPYVHMTMPLYDYAGKKALVIGAGLGTEAAILANRNTVDVFELPGKLKDFCKSRLNGSVHYLEGGTIPEAVADQYDLVVAIDTIEHFHPDEFPEIMDVIANSIKPGGQLYTHSNFEQQDIYPMHFDHAKAFAAWTEAHSLTQVSDFIWTKEK